MGTHPIWQHCLAAEMFQLIEQPLSAFRWGRVPRGRRADAVLAGTWRLFPHIQWKQEALTVSLHKHDNLKIWVSYSKGTFEIQPKGDRAEIAHRNNFQ